jgi:hypothetical protein
MSNTTHPNRTALVVMAAGMGSRYGGIKQLDPVGISGETILEFGLFDAVRAGFNEVVFIIRRDLEADFRRLILDRIRLPVPVRLVFQDGRDLPSPFDSAHPNPSRTKPWGTAQAVWAARNAVDCPFAVINADDFYGSRSYALLHHHLAGTDPAGSAWALVGYRLKNTLSENGAVSRGVCRADARGFLTQIEEHTHLVGTPAGPVESTLADGTKVPFSPETIVSMNMFGFTPGVFPVLEDRLATFLKTQGTDPKAECYLPAAVGSAIDAGEASVKVLDSPESWFGVTFQADRVPVQNRIRDLAAAGLYPTRLWSLP